MMFDVVGFVVVVVVVACCRCLLVCLCVRLFVCLCFCGFMVTCLRFLDEGQPLFLETRHWAREKPNLQHFENRLMCVCVCFLAEFFLDSIV